MKYFVSQEPAEATHSPVLNCLAAVGAVGAKWLPLHPIVARQLEEAHQKRGRKGTEWEGLCVRLHGLAWRIGSSCKGHHWPHPSPQECPPTLPEKPAVLVVSALAIAAFK